MRLQLDASAVETEASVVEAELSSVLAEAFVTYSAGKSSSDVTGSGRTYTRYIFTILLFM